MWLLSKEQVLHELDYSQETDAVGRCLYGLPLACGVASLGFGVVVLSLTVPETEAGRNWLGAILGVVFVLSGLLLGRRGLRGFWRALRWAVLRRRFASEPWRADYEWRPEGARFCTLRTALASIFFALLIGGFLVPFHSIAFFAWPPEQGTLTRFLLIGALLLFDLLPVALLVNAVALVRLHSRMGDLLLRFARFPYTLGEPLAAAVVVGERSVVSAQARLRCLEWRAEKHRGGWAKRGYQLWEETVTPAAGSSEIELRFQLPHGDHGSQLSRVPCRYWELEVQLQLRDGTALKPSFLVPVYAAPGAASH